MNELQFEKTNKVLTEMENGNYSINRIIDILIKHIGYDAIKDNFEKQDVFPLSGAISICKENIENIIYNCYDFDTIQDLNYKLSELIESDFKFVYYSDIDLDVGSDIDISIIKDMLKDVYESQN